MCHPQATWCRTKRRFAGPRRETGRGDRKTPSSAGLRSVAHGGDNMRIGAAPTEIAGHVFANFIVGAGMPLADAGDSRHDLSRRAIAALEGVVLQEGCLHRMQIAAL